MQQVKKQLQDAIAELKSGWGINEVKREDLAAVLDKVVAALDRAAQLPGAPVQPKYVRGIIVAVKMYSGEGTGYVHDGNAPLGSIPALYGERGSSEPKILMYDEVSGDLYTHTNNGKNAHDEYKKNIFFCEGNLLMFSRFVDGNLSSVMLSVSKGVYQH